MTCAFFANGTGVELAQSFLLSKEGLVRGCGTEKNLSVKGSPQACNNSPFGYYAKECMRGEIVPIQLCALLTSPA